MRQQKVGTVQNGQTKVDVISLLCTAWAWWPGWHRCSQRRPQKGCCQQESNEVLRSSGSIVPEKLLTKMVLHAENRGAGISTYHISYHIIGYLTYPNNSLNILAYLSFIIHLFWDTILFRFHLLTFLRQDLTSRGQLARHLSGWAWWNWLQSVNGLSKRHNYILKCFPSCAIQANLNVTQQLTDTPRWQIGFCDKNLCMRLVPSFWATITPSRC